MSSRSPDPADARRAAGRRPERGGAPARRRSWPPGARPGRRRRGRGPLASLGTTTAGLLLALLATACQQDRRAEPERRDRHQLDPVASTRILPGPRAPSDARGVGGPSSLAGRNPYEGNAHAISEGRRMYRWMNCVNCHGNGGGSIGPPLWDDAWVYGGAPAQIAESILRGRPNGMPAFGGRLPEEEVWKIVAYVRSMRPGEGSPKLGVK